MALINILQEALKKIEYALRKASITDYERIQDIRIVVCNAISEIEIYCPDTGNASGEARLREALQEIVARTYSSDRRCRLEYEPVAEICDIAKIALSPSVGYPTDKTRCLPCPRRTVGRFQDSVAQRIERSEPDEGRKDVGSTPIAVAPSDPTADRREIVARGLREFHRNSCYPEAFDFEVAIAADKILAELDNK